MDSLRPLPHLPPEQVFDRIVESLNGRRVDTLFPLGIKWENADYYLPAEDVIAELKELETDWDEDERLRDRLGEMLHKHAGREGVPVVFGTASIRIDLLPDDIRRELMLPFKRKLEGCVKKAARQIRETKLRLNAPNARGLLILVNEASAWLRPDIAFFFLSHILRGKNSSIDHVVYCSINLVIEGPGVPGGGRFWAAASVEGRKEMPRDCMANLFTAFRTVIDSQTGVSGRCVPVDSSSVGTMKFAKPIKDAQQIYVAAGKYYRSRQLGHYYYCDRIQEGSATMYLLESWRKGQRIQAIFVQKLIHASTDDYEVVTDKVELLRLAGLLRAMRRNQK